jgi:hypothetical protein
VYNKNKDNNWRIFMRRVILFALFAAIVTQHGFSQVFLGGSLSYQHMSSKISNTSGDSDIIEISPLFGYRINHLDLGLLFLYQSEASLSDSDETSNIGFGIFGSYNFFTVDRFSISGKVTAQYINGKYAMDNDTGDPYYITYSIEQNINTIGISIIPVFEYKLFEHFSLYTSIGGIFFSHSWGEITGNSSYYGLVIPKQDINLDSFGISLSTGITLGFYVFF